MLAAKIPIGRLGEPGGVGNLVAFLASELAFLHHLLHAHDYLAPADERHFVAPILRASRS